MKVGRFRVFGVIPLIFSIGLAYAGGADQPCNQPSNGPLSRQNVQAVDTAGQAAAGVPDPGLDRAKTTARAASCYEVNGEVGSTDKKLALDDFATTEDAAMKNPNDPNHAQAMADFNAAWSSYLFLTGGAQCSMFAPLNSGGVTRVAAAQCGPSTFAQYKSDLAQIGPSLDFNTKLELLSMLGNKLGNLYDANSGITPLPTVFQSLITNAQSTGECRDIHEFIAVTASSMGLQDAGTTGTDWDNGLQTGAHAVAQFKDPRTGNYVFVNYADVVESDSKYVTEASQQMAQVLNPYSTATQVETKSGTGDPVLHQTQDPRARAIQQEIDSGSGSDSPCLLRFSVGNQSGKISVEKRIVGGPNNGIGVFAAGMYDQVGDPWEAAAGGVRVDVGANRQATQNTQIELKGHGEAGILDVHDDGVQGVDPGGRSEAAVFGSAEAQTDFAWNESKNSGYAGIRFQGEDAIYLNNGLAAGNIPYDTVSVVAADDPSRNVEIHFADIGFISNRTTQDINTAYHHADDAVGVKVSHQIADGITASNDVTVHDFNSHAYGVHNNSMMTFHTYDHGDFSLGTDIAYLKNQSNDDFYDYPITCSIEADYENRIGRFTVNVYARLRCNQHDTYTLMQDDNLASDPQGLLEQPKISAGLQISW